MGQVIVFGGTYCPRGSIEANGALLATSEHSALFSLYGTMYGGDGRTTFGIPDLRGRMVTHVGNGPGLQNLGPQGAKGGSQSFTLTTQNLASHQHTAYAVNIATDASNPSNNLTGRTNIYHVDDGSNLVNMATDLISQTGAGQAYNKTSPYQAIRYCVATQGTYCSRN
ncbi:hypothetical protein AB838_19345 [Rhodobacteraceae bacterium (ex Bugula neritina AB1)]|nr:hypothetical protein AB838_19345 [Rhodobacteraceae bacterium (ex Bugula neritina AB1)]